MKKLLIPRKLPDKSVKGMFLSPINIAYVKTQIIYAVEIMEDDNKLLSKFLKAYPKRLNFIEIYMQPFAKVT